MVNFNSVRELARKEISELLDKCNGTKALVWDEGLTGPFDLLAKHQFFKERSVIRMFSMKSTKLPKISTENIIFITRPGLEQMDKIADIVKNEEMSNGGSGVRIDFHILFVPVKSLLCEMRLKGNDYVDYYDLAFIILMLFISDRGVYGSFTFLDELAVSWFPLAEDVVSMEKPNIFAEYHLKKDPTCLHEMANAIMSIQALYGFAPVVYGKGAAAKTLYDLTARMKREMQAEEPETQSQIDTMIIFDRQVDLISPLITQLTYEGLIDEFFGIKNSSVKLSSEKFAKNQDDASLEASGEGHGSANVSVKQFPLSSSEELYCDLRDKNFNAVGPILSKKVRAVSQAFEERHTTNSVKELKSFVDKLPQMQALKQSLATHTSIAELVKEKTETPSFLEFLQIEQELVNNQNVHRTLDFVEDAACQGMELTRILRVACLQSVISNGLKPKTLETYRKLLLQAYGHVHLTSMINLEKSKLLCSNSSTSASSIYSILRNRLRLTQDDVNEQNPNDITYVHSVYAPLSIRLIQYCSSPGWKTIRDVLDMLPGNLVFI